jgi:hypothetical protein
MHNALSDFELVRACKAMRKYKTSPAAAVHLGLTASGVRARMLMARGRGLTADSRVEDDDSERMRLELREAKQTIERITRENDTADAVRRDIFELKSHTPEPPDWILREGHVGRRGIPCALWSDWHFGEIIDKAQMAGVNEFNSVIAERRVKYLVSTTIDLCYHHMGTDAKKHKYPGIVVCLGGDMMTGWLRDEDLSTTWGTPHQQVNQLTDVLAGAIDTIAGRFGKVFLPAVVGNHGRGTIKPRAKSVVHTSYEWLIYTNLERTFARSKHVQFKIADTIDMHFTICGHKYLLTHGDRLGVKGGDGIIGALGPIMRGALKIGRAEAQIRRDFDTLVIGHWHQYMTPPGVIANGALCGYNEYARNQLRARYERPTQALWFTHPEHGITASWPVYLEKLAAASDNRETVEWHE